jgi:hypothetical protein
MGRGCSNPERITVFETYQVEGKKRRNAWFLALDVFVFAIFKKVFIILLTIKSPISRYYFIPLAFDSVGFMWFCCISY